LNNLNSEEVINNSMSDDFKKFCNSKYYIGSKNRLEDYCKQIGNCDKKKCIENKTDESMQKFKDRIRIELKNYLELNNISFLFGTGSSILLGAVSIRDIPNSIESGVETKGEVLYKLFLSLVKEYQKNETEKDCENGWGIKRDRNSILRWVETKNGGGCEEWGDIAIPLEDFINYLLGLEFVAGYSNLFIDKCKTNENDKTETDENDKYEIDRNLLKQLIDCIKSELFKLCDLENDGPKYHEGLRYHKKFVKSLLGRPLNLRRANIFTTNYDLAFEDTFEELGVHYINGFSGFNKRYFKPEVFDFDMYYPGNLTEGKVSRVEKVIKYFKLHGSLTWVHEDINVNNIYGLRELPIEQVRQKYENGDPQRYENKDLIESGVGNMIIYPTSYKKGYTLDFPYSELFRQFASAITQPQSVLFCVGYSFFDEHINDIIYQALSIPSFTLIIVDLKGNQKIDGLRELNDPRIIILEGEYLGDFKVFADEIMPNFHELSIEEKVSNTLRKIYSVKEGGDGDA
jgi:hypothetical protein